MRAGRSCPLTALLLCTGLLLSAAGLAGKGSLYRDYAYDVRTMPLSALVFLGLHDGRVPELATPGSAGQEARAAETGRGTAREVWEARLSERAAREEDRAASTAEEAAPEEAAAEKAAQEEAASEEAEPEPVYTFATVTESYFDDALFIGDSRTVGLYEYAGLEDRATFYCKTSLTVWDVLDDAFIPSEDGTKKQTLEEALRGKRFGKIYLMVGINELGRGNQDQFIEQYKRVLDRLHTLQPDAILFAEGIMRVAAQKDRTDPVYNNAGINERNERLRQLADGRTVFYIDVNEAVCDETGCLKAEYTFDQIHLRAAYYPIWKRFLLEHGVVRAAAVRKTV